MFIYPTLDPVALQLGPLKIHWYGLMYLLGFLIAWGLGVLRARRSIDTTNNLNANYLNAEQVSDLIFYAALGVVIGGRVGYMLFYDFSNFITHPWIIFELWNGGMAFHGGLLGVLVAVWLYSRKIHQPFMTLMDFIAPLVPVGLGAGRIGNFINDELWGRVTTVPWGMVFPNAGALPRHPSQLYEFFLEGIVLFTILWLYSAKPKPRMAVSGLFALCYGVFRIVAEFFRQPDAQIGFIAFGWLTKGQLLSLPLVILGIILLTWAYHHKQTPATAE